MWWRQRLLAQVHEISFRISLKENYEYNNNKMRALDYEMLVKASLALRPRVAAVLSAVKFVPRMFVYESHYSLLLALKMH